MTLRARALPLLLGLAALGAPSPAHAASTCAAAGLAVTPLQSDVFYVDVDADFLGAYVGYRVAETSATPREGLWLRLESFTGGVVGPADGAASTTSVPLVPLAASAATTSYAYLKASSETGSAQTHDVVVHAGRPGAGGTELCRETQTISGVHDVIQAAANKVDGGSLVPAAASLGSTFVLTVDGHTGTIGAGTAADPGVVRFSPAVAASWPASSFRLVGVEHELPFDPLTWTPWQDVLGRANLAGSGNAAYRVRYAFQVVGPTSSPTPVSPVSNIASGTQVKHTDAGSFASLDPIPVVVNSTTLSVTATGSPFASGTSVGLTASVVNAGSSPVTVDEVVLTMPGGWNLVAGTVTRDGSALPDPHAVGQTLHLVGPFTIPADGTSTFALEATAGSPGSSGAFTAIGSLAGGQLDATTSTTDDTPASVTVAVLTDGIEPPPAPTPPPATPLTSEGTGTDPQTAAVTVPSGGSAHLLDPDDQPVLELVLPGVGTVTIDPASGAIAFVPVLGFDGAPPAVGYRVSDADGLFSDSTYSPSVLTPPGPTAADETSEGVGTAVQTAWLQRPQGGTLTLLDADGGPTLTVTVPGQGAYVSDPDTGEVTFTPVLGFAGDPDPVGYRMTDAYGTSDDGLYAPTVAAPAPPVTSPATSTGAPQTTQQQTVPVPEGGTLSLRDGDGNATDRVEVPGGAYWVDEDGETLRFTPDAGWWGEAPPVTFGVTDAYGQTTTETYRAIVDAPPVLPTVPEVPPAGPAGPDALPEAPAAAGAVAAVVADLAGPPAPPCVSRRTILVHWKVPRPTRLRGVTVSIDGRRTATLPGSGRQALIDMRGRPAGRLVVRVTGRTTTGRRVSATRTYRTCVGRRGAPPLPTLALR